MSFGTDMTIAMMYLFSLYSDILFCIIMATFWAQRKREGDSDAAAESREMRSDCVVCTKNLNSIFNDS